MNRKRRGHKGFTLIEILIVVVIIGILAALILPRFLNAPERAITAEGNQTLGALARAQQQRVDLGNAFIAVDPLIAANWTTLGMVAPTNPKFTYGCAGVSCTATRTGLANGTMTVNTATNVWTCGAAYTLNANGGCQLL